MKNHIFDKRNSEIIEQELKELVIKNQISAIDKINELLNINWKIRQTLNNKNPKSYKLYGYSIDDCCEEIAKSYLSSSRNTILGNSLQNMGLKIALLSNLWDEVEDMRNHNIDILLRKKNKIFLLECKKATKWG